MPPGGRGRFSPASQRGAGPVPCRLRPGGAPSASGTDFSSAAKEEQAIPASIPFTLAFYPEYTLHPARAANRANLTLGSLLYEGLFSVDASFQAQPLLCSGYTVSEDGLTWTFTLREGITFSDGTPLTGTVAAQALRDAMAPDSHYAQRLGACGRWPPERGR